MRIRLITGGIVIGAVSALVATSAVSQDDHYAHQMPDVDTAAMVAASTPGPQHKMLQQFVGEWDTSIKIWFAGPSGPVSETTGHATIESVLDGRFIQEDSYWTIQMPDGAGGVVDMPVHGRGLTGFDNTRQAFISTWADNINTHMLTMRGSADQSGKRITYYGEMDEPGLGVIGRMVKYVSETLDENTVRFEVIDLHAGDDYKVIEVMYRRRQ